MSKTTSATGVWLDKDTGKVVTKAPHRGRQLVAPGHEVTPELQANIDLNEANHATFAAEQGAARPAEPAKKPAAKKV